MYTGITNSVVYGIYLTNTSVLSSDRISTHSSMNTIIISYSQAVHYFLQINFSNVSSLKKTPKDFPKILKICPTGADDTDNYLVLRSK